MIKLVSLKLVFQDELVIVKFIKPMIKYNIPRKTNHLIQENIAIDGKWLRGSDINAQYTQEKHKAILNILDKDIKIVFAHKFLDKNKSSEITALKEVLSDNDIFSDDPQIFSFDATSSCEDF